MTEKDGGDEDTRVCYNYPCAKYPVCRRARGKGCCLDDEGDVMDNPALTVQRGECSETNGFCRFQASGKKE